MAVAAAVVTAAGLWLWARQPELARLATMKPQTFDGAMVAQGARLAAVGDCDVCHTAPGGAAYAGGRAIPTPFGVIYSSNITPDVDTGIGGWTAEAFDRAMRRGIDRRGRLLYPAFPYDHYAKLSDGDIGALYAFVMSRPAVVLRPPPNRLPFPLTLRWGMAAWNRLFLDTRPFRPDPRQSGQWNRGAYLVEGLGHCGDCHTPRNRLGAERQGEALAGGSAEGWQAPALTAASPAPLPWTAEQLFGYLRHGWDAAHGAAAGPMLEVTRNLGRADEQDVRAIADYLASLQVARAPGRMELPPPHGGGSATGAVLFAGACAGCHASGQPPLPPLAIDLSRSTAVNAADPGNALLIIERGIQPPQGQAGPVMPRFAGIFTDAQLAALLDYLRHRYSRQPPWTDLDRQIAGHRPGGDRPRETP